MPQFAPGVQKIATVTMTNPTAAGFDYRLVLYMGVNMVAMGDAYFRLEAGESTGVGVVVVMPSNPGVYPVYLDVWSGETLLGHYRATEDVVIAAPANPSFAGLEVPVTYPEAPLPVSALLSAPAPLPNPNGWDGVDVVFTLYIPHDELYTGSYQYKNLGDYSLASCELGPCGTPLDSPSGLYEMTDLAWRHLECLKTIKSYTVMGKIVLRELVLSGSSLVKGSGTLVLLDEPVGTLQVTSGSTSQLVYSNFTVTKTPRPTGMPWEITASVRVTNNGTQPRTGYVLVYRYYTYSGGRSYDDAWELFTVTLNPGQYADLTEVHIDGQNQTDYIWFIDNLGGKTAVKSIAL